MYSIQFLYHLLNVNLQTDPFVSRDHTLDGFHDPPIALQAARNEISERVLE